MEVNISSNKNIDLYSLNHDLVSTYSDWLLVTGTLKDYSNLFSINIDNSTGHFFLNVSNNYPNPRPLVIYTIRRI